MNDRLKDFGEQSKQHKFREILFWILRTQRFLHRHTEHITVVSLSHGFHLIRPIPKQHVIVQCNNVAILFMQNDYNTGDQNFNLFTLIRATMHLDPFQG